MSGLNLFGTHFITGEANSPSKPDNDNWRLMEQWNTPAEFMQWLQQEKQRLRRELAEDDRLLTCHEHRLTLSIRLAMEKCCLWHYYGIR